MHFYDSIIVFERGAVSKPHAERTGRWSFGKNKGNIATYDEE
jgi:hypothetical protein